MAQMEYTAQNLEYAVSVFYNGEQSDRGRAHAWLTTAQRVPEAWNFVWELLQPTKATEVQFYGATTLHTKILRCWNEVPPESYDELKEKLLQSVFTYSKGPKIVTNRLCISLAAFILQQGTVDLATILRPLSTIENTNLLLEVLTVIPEEYNSMTMGSYLRNKNRTALQQACPAVLDDMLRYLESVYNDYSKEPPSEPTVQAWVSAATCATSWLTLGGEEACEQHNAELPDRMPLCRALLTVVQVLYTWNEAVSDTALDACEACLSAVRAAGGGLSAPKHPAAALQLLADVAAIARPIMQRDNVPNSINEELVSAVVTCCVALCETHSRAVVKAVEGGEAAGEGARQLLDLLLAAQAAPGYYPLHETRSNLVFGFWYTLQDELLNVMDDRPEVNIVWREVFSRLLSALVSKCEAPNDAALTQDDQELLRCYRQDIADAVIYCFGVLGEWCWSLVEREVSSAASGARREAALHVFLALTDAAPHERAPAPLLAVLDHAVHLANTSAEHRMLNTALDCLGGYASWLSSVDSDRARALGEASLRAAGAALERCTPAAALALRKLCAECSASAAEFAPDIVRAAQSGAGQWDAWVRRQLVGAAGSALAAAPPDRAAPLLMQLADSLRTELIEQARLVSSGQTGAAQGVADCCASLLAALCPQPLLAAQLFPVLAPALQPYSNHPDLVEPMFIVLKQVLTTLDDCLPLMADIGQLTVSGINCHPCHIGMEVLKLIVMVVGSEWAESRNVVLSGVVTVSRTLAPEPPSRPDLIEALFSLLTVITKKKPLLLPWFDDLMPDLVDLSIVCVPIWSGSAGRATCLWLSALAARRPHHLLTAAPHITTTALQCIGGLTPRNCMDPLAELLLSFGRASWGAAGCDLGQWLRASLALPGFPTVHATDAHKQKFIAAVIKEKSSKRRLLEAVQEFSLVCRGLVGTEYARQTIASKQLVA